MSPSKLPKGSRTPPRLRSGPPVLLRGESEPHARLPVRDCHLVADLILPGRTVSLRIFFPLGERQCQKHWPNAPAIPAFARNSVRLKIAWLEFASSFGS